MKKLIQPVTKPIHALLRVPGSKSITNRALLLAALSDGQCELSGILISDDTLAMMNALKALGIRIELNEADCLCTVYGMKGIFPNASASIQCAEAGTVARFLTPVCAGYPGTYYFDAFSQMRHRPMKSLLRILAQQGATFVPAQPESLPFTMRGTEKLSGGKIEIEGSQTGQFVSGLLMAAPLAQKEMILTAHELVSRSYVEMTCSMMAEFGVRVRRIHQTRFSVPVPQYYHARNYTIETDFSTASYFFAAAAITQGQVQTQAINFAESKQGDALFLTILEKMGCRVTYTSKELTVRGPTQLRGVNIDMRECSDVFLTVAAMAPFASSPTTITNIGHTRYQESDRIRTMRTGLEKLNVKVEEGPDWLRIFPSVPKGAVIDTQRDHRIAMAFAIIGLRTEGLMIENAECVKKTCPNFFDLWELLYV